MLLASGSTLGPYEIRSLLGVGGMGEVYLAHDPRLNRRVALKVLAPDLVSDATLASRFKQEARAASELNHPNILTIYDIGAADGIEYMATELVEGQVLRLRLQAARPGIAETLDVATQIAAALDVTHRRGIVHRDVKPENVMLRGDGLVKVLDFGLAKLTGGSDDAAAQVRTTPGMVMGTVAYMSPEQARGNDVDARSDLFSLGVLLYEMVAGTRPFTGETATDVLVAIITSHPPPPSRFNAGCPPELDPVVARALAKDREERYQTARELLADLQQVKKRLDAAPIGVAPTAVVPAVLDNPARPVHPALTPTEGGYRTIAVLPFSNLSADRENEYFCDGLAEELLNALAKIGKLRVAARSSAFSFKGRSVETSEVGRALNVAAILEGSVRRSGPRMRVSVQLVDAAGGFQLWSERYDREVKDIFDLEDEITLAVVDALRVKLLGDEEAAVLKRPTADPQAYESYLKGLYFWNKRSREGVELAIGHFTDAVERDPLFALAYTGLANSYNHLGHHGVLPPREAAARVKALAQKAVELDGALAEAHTALAGVLADYEWDWAGVEREFGIALALNSNYASLHQGYAEYASAMGRHTEAIAAIRRARGIDPLSLIVNAEVGRQLYFARRFGEAVEELVKALTLEPSFFWTRLYLMQAYIQTGDLDGAGAVHADGDPRLADDPLFLATLACLQAQRGERDAARATADGLRASAATRYVSPSYLARVHAALGEPDEAFAWLEQSCQERDPHTQFIKVEPLFDPLRSDPRFADILRWVGVR